MKASESESTDSGSAARHAMVQQQLRARGIRDERVLAAMAQVPREEFVSEECRSAAYQDSSLPIDCGQTISQPFTVAFMCQLASIGEGDRVLEIGTGSGYAAAVLSHLGHSVDTVERYPALAQQATERLSRLGYSNVRVHTADGTEGLRRYAPFDAILVAAGARTLPQPLVDQLTGGGRIVIPLGPKHGQIMARFTYQDGQLTKDSFGAFAFVPLIGQHGWQE